MHDIDPQGAAGARLLVDLSAIVGNYRTIQAVAPRTRVSAVVKANAYGLGSAVVSAALAEAGCRDFFVAQLGEVAAVKPAVPRDAVVYVLNGLAIGAETACAAAGAVPVLNSLDQLARWRALDSACPAILQVDSGMARLGLSAEEVDRLAADPSLLDGVPLRYVMSHLACADVVDSPDNARQRARFDAICTRLPAAPRSLANSAGAFLGPDFHYDLIRPGIALYGGAPQGGVANPMARVVALEADIVQLRQVPAGEGIGYGLTAAASTDRVIATISVGYADGWPRRLGNRGSAFVGDTRVPIVGRVSMDSLLLDVSHVPGGPPRAGSAVELLGHHQGIDDVAADGDTISYEILTQLGARYARRYIGASEAPTDRSAPA